jgi:protein-S-isoprenylcysteine O-methyltransferase Ste14
MAELLEALGWRTRPADWIRLLALIGTVTTAILVAGLALAAATPISILAIQGGIWAAWLLWLGIVFPRNGRRDSESPCPYPYRRAFMREILIGISVAFSQFLRPTVAGAVLHEPATIPTTEALVIGVPLLLSGAVLITVGVSALGVARTLFVHEYVAGKREVVQTSIYRFVRHPLFIGGAMTSLGLAICTGDQLAIELGLLNALVCPLYVLFEDRRCCEILGREYADYSVAVGGVVPRRRSAIKPVAQPHHDAGRIRPIAGRAQVTRR